MNETTPETPPEAEAPPEPCCERMDVPSLKPCAVCSKPTCKNCRTISNQKPICHGCREEIEAELVAERPDASRIVTGAVGGAAGALIGGAVWAAVAVFTSFEVGWIAIGVGALAGFGTVLGAGGRKSGLLQGIAVVASVLGLVLGKYFTVAHAIINNVEEFANSSYFDSDIIRIFTENATEFVSGFDLLWLLLALGAAFKIPAATKISMSPKKD